MPDSSDRPAPGLVPFDLRCEGLSDPLATDALLPRLSWKLRTAAGSRGERQSAWQVLAASRKELLVPGKADLWATDRVADSQTLEHPYGGNQRPGKGVWWTVRVWDASGRPSAWAPAARFEFGLLDPSGAGARWIGGGRPLPSDPEGHFNENPAPLLRTTFRLGKSPVVRARACFVGLGYGELHINGRRIGDGALDPGWTHFGKRIQYAVHDIADALRPGVNAVGIVLGNGWYNPMPLKMWGHLDLREHLTVGAPRGLALIQIDLEDGSRVVVRTDGGWKWTDGPILRNSVYLGEQVDLRKEPSGWKLPGFDDRAWSAAVELPAPGGALEVAPLPPVKVVETVPVTAWTRPAPGVWIADFGVNLTGRVAWRSAKEVAAGARLAMRFGERLHGDGTLNPMTAVCGQIKGRSTPSGSRRPATAVQEDAVTTRGGLFEWRPAFTFHGFRYGELTGVDPEASGLTLVAERLNSALAPVSRFACSSPMLEKLFAVTRHTFESNLVSVQSDCPHREKFGYGGDIVATAETALHLLDMGRFYAKTARDFADAQRPNGGFTETAPYVGISDAGLGGGAGPIEWGTAHPLLVLLMHRYHGDQRLLEEQYPAARRWFRLIESAAKDGILDNGLGDHETLVPRSTAVTGTAFLQRNAVILGNLAERLGRGAEAAEYRAKAQRIRDAFQARFAAAGDGKVGLASQACQSVALAWDLVDDRSRVLSRLLEAVAAKDHHVETGIFGTMWLLEALSKEGRTDVAARIALREDFPSWGHMLARGATTLWETWKESDNVYSNNHPMFGSVAGWMVRWLAGLQVADDAVGADRLMLRPGPVPGLEHASATWDGPRGRVECGWRREVGRVAYSVAVPAGSTAELELPVRAGASVLESGAPVERARGVSEARHSAGRWRARLAAGTYGFVNDARDSVAAG
ncbi:MAG: family 78 glycoside hydrolase catalytic domain [Armatimonadota bacterium]